MSARQQPRVAVLYHYFYPDDVVSARHLTHFCLDLRDRGWQVEALPCNRGCRDESITHPLHENWEGVTLRRVWRPRFRQATTLGRLCNATWMVAAWCTLALGARGCPDVIVSGPICSVLSRAVIRACVHESTRPLGVDLSGYSIAEGKIAESGWLAWIVRRIVRRKPSCDLVADLGSCRS